MGHLKFRDKFPEFVWNTIGSSISAVSSLVMLACVTHVSGVSEGGIFAFAFSSAQLLLSVGKFGVRSYQATDINHEISECTYFVQRIFTLIVMFLLGFATVGVFGYKDSDASVIMAVCFMKMSDGVEDVYHGHLQLNNKMNLAGQMLAARNLITLLFFAISIVVSKNLELACWSTAILALVLSVVINQFAVNMTSPVKFTFKINELIYLTTACVPLFLGHFLSLYIYNAPKYAIALYCTPDIQTYYNIIFMPAFAINLISEFIFKPLLTMLARWWNYNQKDKFKVLVTKLVLFIFIITIIIILGCYLWGAKLLSVVYNVDITSYRAELITLMMAGGCSAVVYLLYNVLSTMRKQKTVLVNYAVSSVMITIFAFVSVRYGGIKYATISYFVAEFILLLLMLSSVFNKNNFIVKDRIAA